MNGPHQKKKIKEEKVVPDSPGVVRNKKSKKHASLRNARPDCVTDALRLIKGT